MDMIYKKKARFVNLFAGIISQQWMRNVMDKIVTTVDLNVQTFVMNAMLGFAIYVKMNTLYKIINAFKNKHIAYLNLIYVNLYVKYVSKVYVMNVKLVINWY